MDDEEIDVERLAEVKPLSFNKNWDNDGRTIKIDMPFTTEEIKREISKLKALEKSRKGGYTINT